MIIDVNRYWYILVNYALIEARKLQTCKEVSSLCLIFLFTQNFWSILRRDSLVCMLRGYRHRKFVGGWLSGSRRSSGKHDESGGQHGAPAPPEGKLDSPLAFVENNGRVLYYLRDLCCIHLLGAGWRAVWKSSAAIRHAGPNCLHGGAYSSNYWLDVGSPLASVPLQNEKRGLYDETNVNYATRGCLPPSLFRHRAKGRKSTKRRKRRRYWVILQSGRQ